MSTQPRSRMTNKQIELANHRFAELYQQGVPFLEIVFRLRINENIGMKLLLKSMKKYGYIEADGHVCKGVKLGKELQKIFGEHCINLYKIKIQDERSVIVQMISDEYC